MYLLMIIIYISMPILIKDTKATDRRYTLTASGLTTLLPYQANTFSGLKDLYPLRSHLYYNKLTIRESLDSNELSTTLHLTNPLLI